MLPTFSVSRPTPPSHLPPPSSMRCSSIQTPTLTCLPTLTFPLTRGVQPRQNQGLLLILEPNKAIFCYICSRIHESVHVYSLDGGLVPGIFGWLVLLFLYSCKCLQFLQFFFKSSKGDPVLSSMVVASICLSICHALAGPLWRQLLFYHYFLMGEQNLS